jgi:hypothetical protein
MEVSSSFVALFHAIGAVFMSSSVILRQPRLGMFIHLPRSLIVIQEGDFCFLSFVVALTHHVAIKVLCFPFFPSVLRITHTAYPSLLSPLPSPFPRQKQE